MNPIQTAESSSGRRNAWRGLGAGLIALPLVIGGLLATAKPILAANNGQPAQTVTGSFLASRHAQAEREIDKAVDYQLSVLKQDPENLEVMSGAFTLLLMEGRIREAKPLAQRLLEKMPDDTLVSAALLLDDFKSKRFEAIIKRLDGLSDKGINAYSTPLLKAWAQTGLKRYDAALETLKGLGEKPGFKGLVLTHTGAINLVAGRTEAAIRDFEESLGDRDDIPYNVASILGALYEQQGKRDKAKELYQQFAQTHPRSVLLDDDIKRVEKGGKAPIRNYSAVQGAAEALFDMSSALRQRTSRDIAFAFVQMALYLDPQMTLGKVLLADMYESENRLERANAIYTAIDPKSPFAWSTQLRLANNLDRLDKVDDATTRLRTLAKNHPAQADPLIQLGDLLRGRERYDEAVKAYDEAAKRLPTLERHHWSFFYSRGIALERAKQWSRAEADFLKALDLEPNQPYVLNYLGYSWVDQGLNLDRAQQMIQQAVDLRPNDGYIVDSLGWAHFRLGHFEDAVKELERAVELRPEDPVINDHLGDAYWQVGRRLEARFQWLRARSLNPEAEVLADIEKKLQQGFSAQVKTGTGSDG